MLTIFEYRNSFAQNGEICNKLSHKLLQVQTLNTVIDVRKKIDYRHVMIETISLIQRLIKIIGPFI